MRAPWRSVALVELHVERRATAHPAGPGVPAKAAKAQGFARLSVAYMWQIEQIGPPEQEMIEAP